MRLALPTPGFRSTKGILPPGRFGDAATVGAGTRPHRPGATLPALPGAGDTRTGGKVVGYTASGTGRLAGDQRVSGSIATSE
jgi:hypothetical protein